MLWQVYHVATSVANPLAIPSFTNFVSKHFANDPFLDKHGKPIKLEEMSIFPNEQAFLLDTWFRYKLPLTVAKANPWGKQGAEKRKLAVLEKTADQLSYLARIYQPYTFYACR